MTADQFSHEGSVRPVPRSTDRAVTMMDANRRPRFRFRLRTILLVVAILALLLVVVIQQVQIGRMRDAQAKERTQLTEIIRVLRDHLEGHR
jgi:cytochrome c-type biogenesis protein CcmH/NrfG